MLTGESEDSSSSFAGVVAGCVVGVVVCIAIIALAIFLVWYQKRKRKDGSNQGNNIWQCMQSAKHIIASYLCVHVAILVTKSARVRSENMYLYKLHMIK